jgi:membrane-associated protease RseP (regulator of RpoE activity)
MRLVAVLLAFNAAWLVLALVAARLVGVVPLEASLGLGPVLLRRTIGGTGWTIRALPLGSFLKLEPGEERVLRARTLAFITVMPWVVLLGVCLILGATGDDVVAGFTLLARLVHPLEALSFWNAALSASGWAAVGAVGARVVASNLFPLPSNGITLAVLRLVSPQVEARVRMVGTAVQFVWVLAWLVLGVLRGGSGR